MTAGVLVIAGHSQPRVSLIAVEKRQDPFKKFTLVPDVIDVERVRLSSACQEMQMMIGEPGKEGSSTAVYGWPSAL